MRCSKCNRETEPGQFASYKNKKGEHRRRGICKECRGARAHENFEYLQKWRKEYNADPTNRTKASERTARIRTENKAYIDEIKAHTPCADCKQCFHPVAMDFDHIHGDKVKNVSSFMSGAYKLELIKIEIAKCELVCSNCHRVRTHLRKENRNPGHASVAK